MAADAVVEVAAWTSSSKRSSLMQIPTPRSSNWPSLRSRTTIRSAPSRAAAPAKALPAMLPPITAIELSRMAVLSQLPTLPI